MNRRGKLDTIAVNGPEDVAVEWDAIDWRVHEQNVIRLRRRIFKATREQDWATVRSLQTRRRTPGRGSILNTDRELRTRHDRPPTCESKRYARRRVRDVVSHVRIFFTEIKQRARPQMRVLAQPRGDIVDERRERIR